MRFCFKAALSQNDKIKNCVEYPEHSYHFPLPSLYCITVICRIKERYRFLRNTVTVELLFIELWNDIISIHRKSYHLENLTNLMHANLAQRSIITPFVTNLPASLHRVFVRHPFNSRCDRLVLVSNSKSTHRVAIDSDLFGLSSSSLNRARGGSPNPHTQEEVWASHSWISTAH